MEESCPKYNMSTMHHQCRGSSAFARSRQCSTSVISNKVLDTSFPNSSPWSDCAISGYPWRKQGDRKSAIPKCRLVQESSVFRPVEKYSVALMMYLFPRAVSGRGPIRSIPIHFRTYETGFGCSSGHCLSNLLFTHWQVSHLLQNSQHLSQRLPVV